VVAAAAVVMEAVAAIRDLIDCGLMGFIAFGVGEFEESL